MYNLLTDRSVGKVFIVVASLTTAGPYFSQMGAEVVKIDAINGAPNFRRSTVTQGCDSLYSENLNRARKSAACHHVLERALDPSGFNNLAVECFAAVLQMGRQAPQPSLLKGGQGEESLAKRLSRFSGDVMALIDASAVRLS